MDELAKKKSDTFRNIFFIYVVIYLCYGIIPVNSDNFAVSIGITDLQTGILISVNFLVQMVAILFFGYFCERLSKRFSRKKVFITANLIWAISYGLIALSQNFYHFLTCIIVGAVGIGAFIPIGFSIISDLYSSVERGKRFGIMNFGLVLGSGGGILIGSFLGGLLDVNLGWRLAYLVGCGLALWPTIAYAVKGIDPMHGESEPEFQDLKGKIVYDYKINLKTLTQILKNKTVIGILLIVLTSNIGASVLGYWGIRYLTDYSIGNKTLSIIIYMLAGFGALFGNIWGGKLGDKYYNKGKLKGRIFVSLLGLIIGIILLAIFYLTPFLQATNLQLIGSCIVFSIIGFLGYLFVSMPVGNQYTIISDVNLPENRSTANAFYGFMINISAAIGNPIFPLLVVFLNAYFALSLILSIWLIGLIFWIIPYFYYEKEYKTCRDVLLEKRKALEKIITDN